MVGHRQRSSGMLVRLELPHCFLLPPTMRQPALLLLLVAASLPGWPALASEYDPHPAERTTSFFEGWMTRLVMPPADLNAAGAGWGAGAAASDGGGGSGGAAEAPTPPASVTLIIGGIPNAPSTWNRTLVTMAVQSSRCGLDVDTWKGTEAERWRWMAREHTATTCGACWQEPSQSLPFNLQPCGPSPHHLHAAQPAATCERRRQRRPSHQCPQLRLASKLHCRLCRRQPALGHERRCVRAASTLQQCHAACALRWAAHAVEQGWLRPGRWVQMTWRKLDRHSCGSCDTRQLGAACLLCLTRQGH